jgi:hypothetical protein
MFNQPIKATESIDVSVLQPSAESVCDSSSLLANVLVPVVICWPLWLRFAQNMKQLWETGRRWPFLANAGKYMLNHTIVIFSTLHHDFLVGKVRLYSCMNGWNGSIAVGGLLFNL